MFPFGILKCWKETFTWSVKIVLSDPLSLFWKPRWPIWWIFAHVWSFWSDKWRDCIRAPSKRGRYWHCREEGYVGKSIPRGRRDLRGRLNICTDILLDEKNWFCWPGLDSKFLSLGMRFPVTLPKTQDALRFAIHSHLQGSLGYIQIPTVSGNSSMVKWILPW